MPEGLDINFDGVGLLIAQKFISSPPFGNGERLLFV
jgi:hypothetical protein